MRNDRDSQTSRYRALDRLGVAQYHGRTLKFLAPFGQRSLDHFAIIGTTASPDLSRCFSGERNLGEQTLEIVISGYANSQEAKGALRRQMENLIRT